MDLNEQNDISITLKAVKVAIVFVLIIFMFIVPDNNTYASTNEFQLEDINITMDEKIINKEKAKDESDIDGFLGGGQVSFLTNEIRGLDDFELICFLVIR